MRVPTMAVLVHCRTPVPQRGADFVSALL